jgi:hypothetical protein
VDWAEGLAIALERSPLGSWARGSAIGYPLMNLLHLLGLTMLIGAIGLLDLRLAGLFRALPPAPLARVLAPGAAIGLLLLISSGVVMFTADAGPLLRSPVFRWKLAVIALAIANVAAFHFLRRHGYEEWDQEASLGVRLMAAVSIVLWLGAAALGRLIAYS